MAELRTYRDILADCRFCPMCKPAAEVANIKKSEGYSTRSRAMMLWRIVAGHRDWTPRSVELLYQSTLDGISEAFCVSDRPVSAYTLAARQDVWAAGRAPAPVREAVEHRFESATVGQVGERVLVAAECLEGGWLDKATAVADTLSLDVLATPVGATAFALGASDVARAQAEAAAEALAAAKVVVADGSQTQWLLQDVWPDLGVDLDADVLSLPAYALSVLEDISPAGGAGDRYVLDSRAASYLADALALPVAIQPGYVGEPDDWGRGAIFDDLRVLLQRLGASEARHRWERTLARSTGADDGLWASYPDIATALAVACLERAADAGARDIVTDSPLSAAWLSRVAIAPLTVRWIGELVTAA